MVVYDKSFSVVQDSHMWSLCNMVVLYGDRTKYHHKIYYALRCDSALRGRQDFRVYPIVRQHGCCTAIVLQYLLRGRVWPISPIDQKRRWHTPI